MKFKIKGETRQDTIENISFIFIGLGILLMLGGFGFSVGSSNTLAGSMAIFGSFIFFVFLVILILALFVKEVKAAS